MKTLFLTLLFLSFLSHSSIEKILEKDKTITVDGSKTNFIIFNSKDFPKNSKIYFEFTAVEKCTHKNLLFEFKDDISFQEENNNNCNPSNKAAVEENNVEYWTTETIYSITKDNNRDFLVLCFECPDWVSIQNLPNFEKDAKEGLNL